MSRVHGELIVLVGIGLVESCPGGELSRMEIRPGGELARCGIVLVGSCPG